MEKGVFIFLVLLLTSCNIDKRKQEGLINSSLDLDSIRNQEEVISPLLREEITKFRKYTDSINKESSINECVYGVDFYMVNDTCYLTIASTVFYNGKCLSGYVISDSVLIAIYNYNSCNQEILIDIAKLKKGKPKGFPDENSDIAIHTTFDPWVKKYKIHSKDSLELVFSGFL